MEYFFNTVIKKYNTIQNDATHFVITNNGKDRYFISLKKGFRRQAKNRLIKNISSYSRKLFFLLGILPYFPLKILEILHIGYFVKIELNHGVADIIDHIKEKEFLNREMAYNILVGSYVEKQKVVLQCFCEDKNIPSIFIKIGGENSNLEMHNEISYLENPINSDIFKNPVLLYKKNLGEESCFNIQVTKEFFGKKVLPELNQDIYNIFLDITNYKYDKNDKGIPMAFSHGDFAPWNMKKIDNQYIVFDWEYSGMRFYGYDLIHYLFQINNKLKKMNVLEAVSIAIDEAQVFDKKLKEIPKNLLMNYYLNEVSQVFGKQEIE